MAGPGRDAVPLREATKAWFLISLQTFGGPAGQIAVMQRELVDQRRWIGEKRFLHALSYCMLLPGPEAQRLAIYTGWLLNGSIGGLIGRRALRPARCGGDAGAVLGVRRARRHRSRHRPVPWPGWRWRRS